MSHDASVDGRSHTVVHARSERAAQALTALVTGTDDATRAQAADDFTQAWKQLETCPGTHL